MVETPLRSSNTVAVSILQRPGSTSAKATAGQAGRAPRQDAAITRLRSEATARQAGTLEACRYVASCCSWLKEYFCPMFLPDAFCGPALPTTLRFGAALWLGGENVSFWHRLSGCSIFLTGYPGVSSRTPQPPGYLLSAFPPSL